VQRADSNATTDSTKNGVCHFSSTQFTVDANAFVTVTGGTFAGSINVDASSGAGTDPVVPNASNVITVTGAQVAAGTVGANVIRTDSLAANTYTIEVQRSAAVAATDSTQNGVSHFDSNVFSVDANAFVTTAGKVAISFAADSGTAAPAAGVITIAGGPGVTTSASGSTVTINSVVFTDQAGSTSVTNDSGSFATAAITLTLPAAPAQGDLLIFACTSASALVLDAPSTHLIRIGSLVTSAGGTMTSTAIGDSVTLRYFAASTTWIATSVIGVWLAA